MKRQSVDVIAHNELAESGLSELRRHFDSEYLDEFREWGREQPYGYAAHDIHAIARIDGRVGGHVG